MNGEDKELIHLLERNLRNFALRDIKLIAKQDTVLASFILCSCFIEHISTYRYGMFRLLGEKEYVDFIIEYLNENEPNRYNAVKLRSDLRNRLVHNYSLGEHYVLVMGYPNLHLQSYPDNPTQTFLNLENFINDLEDALNKYLTELKMSAKEGLLDNLRNAYKKVRLIGFNGQ